MKNYLHNRATGLFQRDFWHGERRIGRNFKAGKLGGYYNDLTAKAQPYEGPKSAEGVPLVNLGRMHGFILHPVTVCQVALGWYERWLDEHSGSALGRFIKLADWLVSNQELRHGVGGAWPVPYGVTLYRLSSDWVSALVQGQAISVLVRANKVTGIPGYLSVAESALEPFRVNVSRGGVRRKGHDGKVFFGEYPTVQESRVLNGFISSLWGLYDYAIWAEDAIAQEMFSEGISTLIASLSLYDTGYWSRYSLYQHKGFSNIASPYYHKEHIAQLNATYMLVNDASLRKTAQCWDDYLHSWINFLRVVGIKSLSRFNIWMQSKKSV